MRTLSRVLLIVTIVVLATWASHMVRDALNLDVMPENEQHVHRAIMLGSLAYVLLLTMPFVPGAEIGIAMLTAFGADIAPLIYIATVAAMLLAYMVGHFVPLRVLTQLLSFFRMKRAAALVDRLAPLSGDARLAALLEHTQPRFVDLALRQRYLALAVLVNMPGNAIIGGGGGIMLVAGLSGLFAPVPTALAVALAVSPVPLAVILIGL